MQGLPGQGTQGCVQVDLESLQRILIIIFKSRTLLSLGRRKRLCWSKPCSGQGQICPSNPPWLLNHHSVHSSCWLSQNQPHSSISPPEVTFPRAEAELRGYLHHSRRYQRARRSPGQPFPYLMRYQCPQAQSLATNRQTHRVVWVGKDLKGHQVQPSTSDHHHHYTMP